MRWADPWYFLFLVILPLLFYWNFRTSSRIKFSSIELIKKLRRQPTMNPRLVLLTVRIVVILLVILALARPQSGRKFTEEPSEGVDIILAIDTSGSMRAVDFEIDNKPVTRLEVVKKVVADFIEKRKGDRLGLVVFGEDAFTQCPLTLDHNILQNFLGELEIGMAGDSTAVGSAIGVSVKRLKDLKAKSKIVILLTDGRSNAGRVTPKKAAELAAD